MDSYIAELDEAKSIVAVWVKREKARGASVFDPRKHIFEPKPTDDFVGAPREGIVSWLAARRRRG